MLRIKITFLAFIVCSLTYGQNDSLSLRNANWSTQELAPGVKWKTATFSNHDLFNANQVINIVEISPDAKGSLLRVIHSDSLELTSQMAVSRNAIAAINGSFFKMRGPDPDNRKDLNGVPKKEPSNIGRNRSVVYLREKDSVIAENPPAKDGKRKRNQQGVIAINNGMLIILRGDSTDLNWEHSIVAQDVLSTGPTMIIDGTDQLIASDAFSNDRHPRTAVGRKADGTMVLFVVDGRSAESAGMSIPELQRTFRWLGCTDAINLDGGGSTTMYIKGQPFNGVVNYPSDNKKFDHEGEREVANAILLMQQ